MRVSTVFVLLFVIAVAQAIPAPKINKDSSIDDVEIEKKDLKIGEEIGDDKERAKKSATFCVEVRSGSKHAKAVPCGCAQQPCECNKQQSEEVHQAPCGCHKHQPHQVHQTVHTVHIVQQEEESKEESKEEPCEEATTPAPVVLESTVLPETTTPEVIMTEPPTTPSTTTPSTTTPSTTTTEVEIVTEPPKSEKMMDKPCKDQMVVVQLQPPRCQHHAVITECDCKPPSMPIPVMPMPMMDGMYPMAIKDHAMHHLFKERMHMMPAMEHKIERWSKA